MMRSDCADMASLASLLNQLGPHKLFGDIALDNVQITGVTADSRQVRGGELFVAVPGAQFDGHQFLPSAVEHGAAALVGELSPTELSGAGMQVPAAIPYVQVENSRHALADCAANLCGFPSRRLTVVGVTGTDGKTTTCSILESILAAATRSPQYPAGRVGVITTVGARIMGEALDTGLHVTTPDAPQVQGYLAQMVAAGCIYAIVESTSHGLDQGRVDAVEFDVAAVTNITHEHLDYHGSRPAYVQAKAKLFRKLGEQRHKDVPPRLAVLNADDAGSYSALHDIVLDLVQVTGRKNDPPGQRVYGISHQASSTAQGATQKDVFASAIHYAPEQTTFSLSWWAGEFPVTSNLIGEFNVSNILCAATIALGIGIAPAPVQSGIAAMQGVSGRMERIDCGQSFLAIVDFAHSPVSLERALTTLRPLVGRDEQGQPGRLIAVFGCAGLRDVEKRRLMGRASGRLADFTVVTAEDPRTEDLSVINQAIANGLLETTKSDRFTVVPDRGEAIQFAVNMARQGDIVAAFGKGHEQSMCFGTTEYPWSDQAAMIEALQRKTS